MVTWHLVYVPRGGSWSNLPLALHDRTLMSASEKALNMLFKTICRQLTIVFVDHVDFFFRVVLTLFVYRFMSESIGGLL